MVQWGKNILRTDKHPVQRTVKGWGHAVNSRIKRVFVLVPIKYSTQAWARGIGYPLFNSSVFHI